MESRDNCRKNTESEHRQLARGYAGTGVLCGFAKRKFGSTSRHPRREELKITHSSRSSRRESAFGSVLMVR
jgi:hypothetical protein